ncbi:MAG: AraC family transcriptional regulator [Oscillibacter sp.]|nr:AraC family transcriptional regulator [Oscillibacter sp.]
MAISPCKSATDGRSRELVRHGTAQFPVACYRHDGGSANTVPWHWHDELEAILIKAGSVSVSVEGESRELRAGEGCFISAGVLHRIWREGEGEALLRSMVFHPRLVGGSVESVFWQGYLQPLLSSGENRWVWLGEGVPWQREALEALDSAWRACREEPQGFEFLAREGLSRLVFLLSAHRPAKGRGLSEKALRDGERIKAMLRHVEEHFDEELTVERIARSAAVSESECLRCFRSVLETTPIQYVKQFRIQRAAELLESTDERIADIGARCGFQEMSYFARAFRALKGRTPSQYRAERRASDAGGGTLGG